MLRPQTARPQTAAATARGEIHWDEASTDGEELEEELEMTEGKENVELSGNSGLYVLYCSSFI